mgnify:FL=1
MSVRDKASDIAVSLSGYAITLCGRCQTTTVPNSGSSAQPTDCLTELSHYNLRTGKSPTYLKQFKPSDVTDKEPQSPSSVSSRGAEMSEADRAQNCCKPFPVRNSHREQIRPRGGLRLD